MIGLLHHHFMPSCECHQANRKKLGSGHWQQIMNKNKGLRRLVAHFFQNACECFDMSPGWLKKKESVPCSNRGRFGNKTRRRRIGVIGICIEHSMDIMHRNNCPSFRLQFPVNIANDSPNSRTHLHRSISGRTHIHKQAAWLLAARHISYFIVPHKTIPPHAKSNLVPAMAFCPATRASNTKTVSW